MHMVTLSLCSCALHDEFRTPWHFVEAFALCVSVCFRRVVLAMCANIIMQDLGFMLLGAPAQVFCVPCSANFWAPWCMAASLPL